MSALQEVLKMSIQTQGAEGTSDPKPMSEDTKEWLSGALSSVAKLSTDIANEMKEHLANISLLLESTPDPKTRQEINEIMEEISQLVDDLDLAQDFVKMGGHTVLLKCLQYEQLMKGSCEILATITQNNPMVQKIILQANLIPTYLSLLSDQSLEEAIKKKVLYALSCLCRGHQPAVAAFREEKGIYKLIPFIDNLDSLLSTKAVFFIKSLISDDSSLKQQILTSGLLEILVKKLKEPRKPTHEHILCLLSLCLTQHDATIAFCRQEGVSLLSSVQQYQQQEDIYEEEKEACEHILTLLA